MSERDALDGLKVLSLGAFVAGNTVGQLLAELGADVVKIESPSRPEVLRNAPYTYGRLADEPSGATTTGMFGSLARSVRGLAVEMGSPPGQQLFRRLAREADVVVENFGATVMSRWGCGFDSLRAERPSLVMLSMSGYGRTGPRAEYRAYASAISSFVGLHHHLGKPHLSHHDYIMAIHGVVAVMAALHQAGRTGGGTHLDIAQIETGGSLMASTYLAPMNAVDEAAPAVLLSGVYRCRGFDEWLVVELESDADWQAVSEMFELTGVAQDDAGRAALDSSLRTWASGHSAHAAALRLHRLGLAAAVVQNGEDLTRDPQLRARGAIYRLRHPDLGACETVGPPYQFSSTPAGIRRPAPRLGEHTRAVLAEWIGASDEAIDALAADGVILAL